LAIKLSKNELQKDSEDPLTLFKNGIKSKKTLEKYERILKIFLCHTLEEHLVGNPQKRQAQKQERLARGIKKEIEDILDADFEERVKEFVDKSKKDPQWALAIFKAYANKLIERTRLPQEDPDYLNPNSFDNKFKPIKKLFKMNSIPFVWDIIDAMKPEPENDSESRGYEREEISKILEFTNPMETAAVLLASSSGLRRGGFDFTWNCIIPIYRRNDDYVMGQYNDENDSDVVCGMITVYKGTPDQYFAFFTPEAWKAIRSYMAKWKDDVLRTPQPHDPFLKKAGKFVIPLSPDALANRLYKVIKPAGIRKPLTNGKRRYEIPIMNGFRRFFNKVNKETLSRDSPLAALIKKEMMMAHTGLLKLDKNYFKTHWKELVDEYLNAVPALTISSEMRQKLTNMELRKKLEDPNYIHIPKAEFDKMIERKVREILLKDVELKLRKIQDSDR
jgi:hypothetical protein